MRPDRPEPLVTPCAGGECAPPAEASAGGGAGASAAGDLTECTGGVDLTGLDGPDSRHVLVGQTARFSASFLRWMESRTMDGMSYARLRLLQALRCGGPAIMRDLGTQLGATPRNMTAIVDALEDAQLVVRRPHPTDRRATLIELSPEGEREAEQATGPRLDAMSAIFTSLSADERAQFSGVMSRLMHAMLDREREC